MGIHKVTYSNSFLSSTRIALGLSQAEVARKIGVKPSTVASWELGRVSEPADRMRSAVIKLAELYNVSPDYITDVIRSTANCRQHVHKGKSMLSIPSKLYNLRREAGWSRKDVSEITGISKAALGVYETGRCAAMNIDAATVSALADLYQLTEDDIRTFIRDAHDARNRMLRENPEYDSYSDALEREYLVEDDAEDDTVSTSVEPSHTYRVPDINNLIAEWAYGVISYKYYRQLIDVLDTIVDDNTSEAWSSISEAHDFYCSKLYDNVSYETYMLVSNILKYNNM